MTRWIYTLAVFLGAFLLFHVQPMASRAILPNFGGSYLVWGGCMVFFQGVLLIGYAYAHVAHRCIGVVRYARWHPLVLCLPFVVLVHSTRALEMEGPAVPLVFRVAVVLGVSIGLPFLALSTVSVTLQRWYSVDPRVGGANPYVLYSASNAGSILGLLCYPLVFEPFLTLVQQWRVWWAAYAVLVVLHLACRPRAVVHADATTTDEEGPPLRIEPRTAVTWWLLSAAGSAMLLAVTNLITFDVASIPFLWVLPLCVYLMTFVLAFRDPIWFPVWCRKALAWTVIVGIVIVILSRVRLTLPILAMLPLQLGVLFFICMNCHGHLALAKPTHSGQLTSFYLVLAFGGVCGSIVVTWIVPLISTWLLEYPLALVLACAGVSLAAGGIVNSARKPMGAREFMAWAVVCVLALSVVPWSLSRRTPAPALVLAIVLAVPVTLFVLRAALHRAQLWMALLVATLAMNWTQGLATGSRDIARHRNYYGIYRVHESESERFLQHGTTVHGSEYVEGPLSGRPTGYYAPDAPAPQLLSSQIFSIRDIGMIGLGTGALPWYAPPGSKCTIFELDPDNRPIAEEYFTYLRGTRSRGVELDFVYGDGRVRLRSVADASLDLFVVDAFNSGSIPVHLMTREAVEEYLRVLRPGGVLLMHISNRVLDLEPVLESIAHAIDVPAYTFVALEDKLTGRDETHWVLMTRDASHDAPLCQQLGWERCATPADDLPRAWTDDYSNLFRALVR